MSWGVTRSNAVFIAPYTVSVVRPATERRTSLAWDHNFSIGERSGLYGGKGCTCACASSTAARASPSWWALRLSQITTSPEQRCGFQIWSTYCSLHEELN